MFKTPILAITPDKAPAPPRTVSASSRRRLDLTAAVSPTATPISDDQIKIGVFVVSIDGDRKDDIGTILKVTGDACTVLWRSDSAL